MSTALEVATGIVFLYLLLALIVTTLQELVATALSWRAQALYEAIESMLRSGNKAGTEALVKKVYEHPLLKNLARPDFDLAKKKSLPSYIPSRTFALALVDVLKGEAASCVFRADPITRSGRTRSLIPGNPITDSGVPDRPFRATRSRIPEYPIAGPAAA